MTNLIIMHDCQAVTSSLNVAETFGKNHNHVLRDIDSFKEGVQNWTDLFQETTYTHEQNKQEYRMYLMNRDGFTLLAMGFTGKEALQFKLQYINAFNQMEKEQQPKQLSPSELALLHAQNMVALERKQAAQDNRIEKIETEQQNISEIIGLTVVEWRKKVTSILNRIALAQGGYEMFQQIKNESYKILEERGKCNLSLRVINKQKNMAVNGVAKSTVNKVSKLDAISDNARLTEIYLAIVKELAVKYRVNVEVSV